MTHEIEVKVKVENVAGEIVFYVSDMPRVETGVRKNLANFDNWLYAKWIENGEAHCLYSQREEAHQEEKRLDTLGSLALSQDLANDTIRIALGIAGYDISAMNQFERASAILDMAQEHVANLESIAHYESVFDKIGREIANVRKSANTWERLYTRTWKHTLSDAERIDSMWERIVRGEGS